MRVTQRATADAAAGSQRCFRQLRHNFHSPQQSAAGHKMVRLTLTLRRCQVGAKGIPRGIGNDVFKTPQLPDYHRKQSELKQRRRNLIERRMHNKKPPHGRWSWSVLFNLPQPQNMWKYSSRPSFVVAPRQCWQIQRGLQITRNSSNPTEPRDKSRCGNTLPSIWPRTLWPRNTTFYRWKPLANASTYLPHQSAFLWNIQLSVGSPYTGQ